MLLKMLFSKIFLKSFKLNSNTTSIKHTFNSMRDFLHMFCCIKNSTLHKAIVILFRASEHFIVMKFAPQL